MIWIVLFLQTIFQYKFYCTSCCCVVLVTSLSMYPTQILLFRFYSLVIKLTLDRGDSWDSSSSVECMLTNQLPIKKGKKDDRNFRVLLDFIKVCLCEVYKDQKWVVARNQRRSEWTNIVYESIFVDSILSTLLAAVLPNGTCTLCLKQVPL